MAHTPYRDAPTHARPIDPAALVFIAAKKVLTAVDGATGHVVWSTEIPGSRWTPAQFMTVAADPLGVYACRNGWVTCLDPLSGEILWSIKPPGAGSALPVVATMMSGVGGSDTGHQSQIAAAAAAQAAAAAAG